MCCTCPYEPQAASCAKPSNTVLQLRIIASWDAEPLLLHAICLLLQGLGKQAQDLLAFYWLVRDLVSKLRIC